MGEHVDVQRSGWFGEAERNSKLLDPLNNLNSDRHKWTILALSASDDKKSNPIVPVAGHATQIYSVTQDEVEKRITELIDEDANASAETKSTSKQHLQAASKALKDWKTDRRAGLVRKTDTGIQSTLCTIGDFLKSFSGIAEIIKGASPTFGGLAYGTVLLLASVAVHKQKREDDIEEALEELSYAFPRLETLQGVRPNDVLRGLIVQVFELVILFCRESIEYFAQRLRRIGNAFSPGKMKMKTLSALRVKLAEIRRECEVMVLVELADARKQLLDVQLQLRQIRMTGIDTNVRVREGHSWIKETSLRAKESFLSDLKRVLGLTQREVDELPSAAAQYKSLLTSAFSDQRRKTKSPQLMSNSLLEEEKVFDSWSKRDESSVLLLGGSNWIDDSSMQHNWLSFASVTVVERTDPANVLFYFCQPTDTVSNSQHPLFVEVMSSLIYQLAVHHSHHLRSRHDEILEALASPEWQHSDFGIASERMIELLVSLLATIGRETNITIVVDRLDQCCANRSSDNGIDELRIMVDSILNIVKDASLSHLCVKILLVLDENPARQMARSMKWERGNALEWKVDWDQAEDTDD